MKRPIVFICLSMVLGILIAGNRYWIYVGFLLLCVWIYGFFKEPTKLWKFLLVLIGFCVFGYGCVERVESKVSQVTQSIDFEKPIQAEASVEQIVFKNGKYKLVCSMNTIVQESVVLHPKIKVLVYAKDIEGIDLDDLIALSGTMKSFTTPSNPGGFDAYHYYFGRKIYFGMFGDALQLMKKRYGFMSFFGGLRDHLEKQNNTIYPSDEADIMNTLLLGTTDELSIEIKKLYQISGISHLLAISGLHVSVIGMGIFHLLKKIIKKEKICASMACALIWCYCLLSGCSTSALRSTIMITIMLLTCFFGEKYDSISSLFLSGIIILSMNPYQLRDVGFLLSFCAVAGIVYATPELERQWNQHDHLLLNLIFITLGASLFTYPIIVWFFYQISVYSLFVNLIVVPTSSVLIGFGMMAIGASLISTFLGNLSAGIVFFALKYIEMICIGVMYLPFHTLTTGKPSVFSEVVYCLALFIWIGLKKIEKKKMMLLGLITLYVLIGTIQAYQHKDGLKMTFLDVGQGDCAVIEYNRKIYLVDGGGDILSTSELNTGHYVVMPYLASQGIGKIDGIFISHSDFDHIYGIIEVIKEIPTAFIVLSEPYLAGGDDLTKELLEVAKEKGIAIYYFREGYAFREGAFSLECIYPGDPVAFYKNNNSKSLVLMLRYKDFEALLTGDLEKEQEAELIKNETMDIDVIKVPHHGSITSSSENFIKSVAPKVAILSYGLHNQFGHPAAAVVERYRKQNCEDYHVALEGAVIVTTKGKDFTVECYRSKRKEIYSCNN